VHDDKALGGCTGWFNTLSLGKIASVSRGAAVRVVGAAIGIRVWAATELAVSEIAASFGVGASSGRAISFGLNQIKAGNGQDQSSLNTFSLGKITSVSRGAAVSVVGAAISIRVWAATELAASEIAASFVGRASSGRAISFGLNQTKAGYGYSQGSLNTFSLGKITSVSHGAAVSVVSAAIGTRVWAATVLAASEIATSFGGRTSSSRAIFRLIDINNGKSGNGQDQSSSLHTFSLGKITSVSIGAAVSVVSAAIGIRVWAATVLAVSEIATSFGGSTSSSRASFRLNQTKAGYGYSQGSLNTLSLGKITSVSIGAAVRVVSAAIGIWVWAATELAVSERAASFGGRASSIRAVLGECRCDE